MISSHMLLKGGSRVLEVRKRGSSENRNTGYYATAVIRQEMITA